MNNCKSSHLNKASAPIDRPKAAPTNTQPTNQPTNQTQQNTTQHNLQPSFRIASLQFYSFFFGIQLPVIQLPNKTSYIYPSNLSTVFSRTLLLNTSTPKFWQLLNKNWKDKPGGNNSNRNYPKRWYPNHQRQQ